ncbi:MAG: B12-binding domain-containing radical SAM protein [Actinobacteria bacterium]|nr:B12-binding domain-containing radical SAM protein [Actinomycetota bacterium]
MKLLLIAPAREEAMKRSRKHKSLAPPLNLGIVAALTPPHIEVSLVDENIAPVDTDSRADLVGITAVTQTANRAYRIADGFRRRGVPVVLGGIHPSVLPEEALLHADAVVIGEAEEVWPRLLKDLQEGHLQKTYRGARRPDLAGLPWARRDVFSSTGYRITASLATTRGCPFCCAFCTVTSFFGHTYRFRPIPEVIEEVESIRQRELVFFVDDNIAGNPKRAKELFRSLLPYKIRWISQASINVARDAELLELAAASGCSGLFIGIESLSSANIASVSKQSNRVEEYEEAIEKIHSYGIPIAGSFIFGFDYDDESVFEETVRFVKRTRIETPQYGILTPFPGTAVHERMEREGRILTRDWSRYRLDNVVFQPRLMSKQTLQQGHDWAWKHTFSVGAIFNRVGFLRSDVLPLWIANLNFRGHRPPVQG